MKFLDIKPGDTVLIEKCVIFGFGNPKCFWVNAAVTRTTPKQLLIGHLRYAKEDGHQIAGPSYARLAGDELPFNGGFAQDETDEMNKFIMRENQLRKIRSAKEQLKFPHHCKHLDEIEALLAKLFELSKVEE